MGLKEFLLLTGVLTGQTDEEIIKFAQEKNPTWTQSLETHLCKRAYDRDLKKKETPYEYSSAHERYWDAIMGKKGADKAYHKKHDKPEEYEYDQDHDGKGDCIDYNKDRKTKDAEVDPKEAAHRKEMERIVRVTGQDDEHAEIEANGGFSGFFKSLFHGSKVK